ERATQRQLARLLAKMPEHARIAFNLQRSTLPSDLGNYIEEAELVAKALSFWLTAQEETGNENKKSDDKKSEKDKKQKKEKRRNQQDKRATTETKKMEKLKKKARASTSTSSSEPPPARIKGAEKRALDDWQLSEVQSFAAEWAVFAQAAAQKRAAETEFLQLLGKAPVEILDFYDLRRAALPARILSFVEDVGEVDDKALAHWTWKAAERGLLFREEGGRQQVAAGVEHCVFCDYEAMAAACLTANGRRAVLRSLKAMTHPDFRDIAVEQIPDEYKAYFVRGLVSARFCSGFEGEACVFALTKTGGPARVEKRGASCCFCDPTAIGAKVDLPGGLKDLAAALKKMSEAARLKARARVTELLQPNRRRLGAPLGLEEL
ncbi:unnamed protein product, partial [Effrenium voratum]